MKWFLVIVFWMLFPLPCFAYPEATLSKISVESLDIGDDSFRVRFFFSPQAQPAESHLNSMGLFLKPCRISPDFPLEQDFSAFQVQVLITFQNQEKSEESTAQSCIIQILSIQKKDLFLAKPRRVGEGGANPGEAFLEVRGFFSQENAVLNDLDRDVREKLFEFQTKKIDSVSLQSSLKEILAKIAYYESFSYSHNLLERYFNQNDWNLSLSTVHAVCKMHRYEFLDILTQQNFLAQVAGSPHERWLKKCMVRLSHLASVEKYFQRQTGQLQEIAPLSEVSGLKTLVDDPQMTTLFLEPSKSSDLLEKLFLVQLNQENLPSEKRKRLLAYLLLYAGKKQDGQRQLALLELILENPEPFQIKILLLRYPYMAEGTLVQEDLQDGMDELLFLRMNPINLRFLKGQIQRDQLNEYPLALETFQRLTEEPATIPYVSIHPFENSFSQPVKPAAEFEVALTLWHLSKTKKACQAWLNVAIHYGSERIQEVDGYQTFCQQAVEKSAVHAETTA